MEVSVMGNYQGNAVSTELAYRNMKFCCVSRNDKLIFSRRNSGVCLVGQGSRWRTAQLRFTLKAVHSQRVVQSDRLPASKPESSDGVKLFVGLPLDVVSDCNTVNHEKAITAGLKALKLLEVEGVELPLWWGAVEKEARGKYEWSCYLSVAEMVKKAGLKLHVSLCFHASKQPKIPLPDWVSKIGESQPSIFYRDRTGKHYKDCLSLAVDDLPVLDGKTPVQVYQEFCESFKSAFMPYMGTTITGISMGLGPDGELRYPSHHRQGKSKTPAVGEFHCYDENMLRLLKQHAEATGNPLWGLGGPHDVPNYDQSPNANTFFKDRDGSWESPYGDFFLSWYSSQLISHGNHLLSLASSIFRDTGLNVHGKVPLMHSWYKTRSHASELTAGFYNTINREGYAAVAEMFMKNSCIMTLPGMDLSDHNQGHESSSPESLLRQIKAACRLYGVEISGQNSSLSDGSAGFDQIRKNLSGEKNAVNLFAYQRMGASFFSPDHFPSFTQFVRNLSQSGLHSDNLAEEEEITESSNMISETSIQVQTV